jgi:hypothetical protein
VPRNLECTHKYFKRCDLNVLATYTAKKEASYPRGSLLESRSETVSRFCPCRFTMHNHPHTQHLSIYGCTALVDLGHFFSLLSYTQSVGLLGHVISPSLDRYLHTE